MRAKPRFDVASLLPHGVRARFITEVVQFGDDGLVCLATIGVDSPFARGGTAPGFVLLEIAAQAAAVEVLARMSDSVPHPRIGYLALASGVRWHAEGVPVGAPLTASVRREDSIPPLYVYRAIITLDGVEVFAGRFGIHVEEALG